MASVLVTQVALSIPRYGMTLIRAVVFDVGECLEDETLEYGTRAS
jgi:hypothetical protein